MIHAQSSRRLDSLFGNPNIGIKNASDVDWPQRLKICGRGISCSLNDVPELQLDKNLLTRTNIERRLLTSGRCVRPAVCVDTGLYL